MSGLVSLVGLAEIIRLTAPILDMIYPPAIVLVLFIVIAPALKGARSGAVLAAFGWGIFEGICGYTVLIGDGSALLAIRNLVPGAGAGFGWVVVTIIGAVIGHLTRQPRKNV